ncbi:MAG: ABC1 kinase family protein [Acidimicrobiales bacterium]
MEYVFAQLEIVVIAAQPYCEDIHEHRRHAGRWSVAAGALTAIVVGLRRAPMVRTLLRRWATIGGLGGRTSARTALHGVRRMVSTGARRQELDGAFQLRSAEDVAATLGNMKGAFMKVGQLLSFVDDGLPENVRTALAQLQDSAPAMSAALAASVIEAELGGPPQDVFATWEPEPFAAASIGQVHRATTRDGRPVAVKVQYPGAAAAMEADLAQLGVGRLVLPFVHPNFDVEAITAELRERLLEEHDYGLEATNQRDFATWYAGHPFIRIPAVVDELSTKRVLTTDFAPGARFAEAERWDQSERDLAAEAILRFVYRSLHDHLAFNGDPHPGNYLFQPGGVVTFLDFGLVKRLRVEDRDAFIGLAHASAIEPDARKLRASLEDIGFYVKGAPISDSVIVEFDDIFWNHLAEDREVTLTAAWATDAVRRYMFKQGEFREIEHYTTIPAPFVIMQRITFGLTAILGRLNATANWRRIAMELWFGGEPATPMGEAEAAWRGRSGPVGQPSWVSGLDRKTVTSVAATTSRAQD